MFQCIPHREPFAFAFSHQVDDWDDAVTYINSPCAPIEREERQDIVNLLNKLQSLFQKFFGRNTDIDMTCRNGISHKQMDQKYISEKNVKFPYKAKTMQVHIIAVIVVKCLYNLVIVRF